MYLLHFIENGYCGNNVLFMLEKEKKDQIVTDRFFKKLCFVSDL